MWPFDTEERLGSPRTIHTYVMEGASFPINLKVDPADSSKKRAHARGFQVIGAGTLTVKCKDGSIEPITDLLDRESIDLQFSTIEAVTGITKVRVVW